jgi:head-to-tail connecting protein
MAKPPTVVEAPKPNPLEKEAIERIATARINKYLWGIDFRECYFFSAPHRQRQIYSQSAPPVQRILDAPELQTSLGFDLCGEFVTEVTQTFMPEHQNWVQAGKGMFIKKDQWDQVKDTAKENDDIIFEAIKASNFYAEIPKAYDPDLAIGTAAVWIDQPRPDHAIQTLAVPLREFEGSLGPNGEIDDRFAVRWTRNRYVKTLLPGVKIPQEILDKIDKDPETVTDVVRGFWRIWDRPDETWQYVALVGNKLVDKKEVVGEGSCPLIPTRFNPSSDWVWGIGPMFKTLPDHRQIDELEASKIKVVLRNIDGPVAFPDDSFANVAQGLEDGFAYPVRPGTTKESVFPIYPQINMDTAIYQHDEMEHRMRRMFYVDFPQQSGDTPPTAAQWMDELARAQRRIGTPGMSFWREGPMQYYIRFKYLLERAGAIMPLQINGKTVSARPLNPAQRAAEQQEVAMAAQFIQLAGQAWPEEFKLMIDGKLSMMELANKMRVTLIKFRKPEQVEAAMKQITPLLQQHFAPGAPQQPGQEQPAGPMQ